MSDAPNGIRHAADCVRAVPLPKEGEPSVVDQLAKVVMASRQQGRSNGRVDIAVVESWREGDDRTPFLAPPSSPDAVVPEPGEPAFELSLGAPIWKSVRKEYNRICERRKADAEENERSNTTAARWGPWLGVCERLLRKEEDDPDEVQFHLLMWNGCLEVSDDVGHFLRLKADVEGTLTAYRSAAAVEERKAGTVAKRKKGPKK